MNSESLDDERRAVVHAARCYATLAKHLPVTTTLGELIVLTEVAKGVYENAPMTVSDIQRNTGITRWAVSRIIIRYINNGAIREIKDPADNRRNLLTWTPESFAMSRDWTRDWIKLM